MTEIHCHAWTLLEVRDECHSVRIERRCFSCGATQTMEAERDLAGDPYEVLHLRPETCERCAELAGGAPARQPVSTIR